MVYPEHSTTLPGCALQLKGWQVSTSMVGRILTKLKDRGVLREPPRTGISVCRRLRPRPYAVRKPKGYDIKEPGDLVQVDTLDVRPLPGVMLKHFTARDVVSRWDVLEAYSRPSAEGLPPQRLVFWTPNSTGYLYPPLLQREGEGDKIYREG